jgi:hypothetical protein
MHDYLKLWADDFSKRTPLQLKAALNISGGRDKHLGPRAEYAKIKLRAEPAEIFEVVDLVPPNEDLTSVGYPDWVIFGLLDVLMVAESAPLTAIRIVLEEAEYHPIHSSRMAFRQAGRDAGGKIITANRST